MGFIFDATGVTSFVLAKIRQSVIVRSMMIRRQSRRRVFSVILDQHRA